MILSVSDAVIGLDPVLQGRLFRALGDSSRLRIVAALADGERRVCDITAKTGLSQPNASKHLASLHDCGLVVRERRGREVFYASAEGLATLLEASGPLLDGVATCSDGCAD